MYSKTGPKSKAEVLQQAGGSGLQNLPAAHCEMLLAQKRNLVHLCLYTFKLVICLEKRPTEIFSSLQAPRTPVRELWCLLNSSGSDWFFTVHKSCSYLFFTYLSLVSHSPESWHKRLTCFLDTFLLQPQRLRNSSAIHNRHADAKIKITDSQKHWTFSFLMS